MLTNLWAEFGLATLQTLYMVGMSTLVVTLLGLPLGTWLYSMRSIHKQPLVFKGLSIFINAARSVPFIILLVAIIPFTRLVVGSAIGVNAAMVPLVIAAIPFFARLVDNVYMTLGAGLIETGFSLGMRPIQLVRYILLPEARPALIQAVTVTAVTLVNYSAMAGTVGGGGLGDFAIRYGYQRFEPSVMVVTVVVLIALVQAIQWAGDRLSAHYTH